MVKTSGISASLGQPKRMHWSNDYAIILSPRSHAAETFSLNVPYLESKVGKNHQSYGCVEKHWCSPKRLSAIWIEKIVSDAWFTGFGHHHFWRIFHQQDRITGEHDAPKFTVQLSLSEFTEFNQICMFNLVHPFRIRAQFAHLFPGAQSTFRNVQHIQTSFQSQSPKSTDFGALKSRRSSGSSEEWKSGPCVTDLHLRHEAPPQFQ